MSDQARHAIVTGAARGIGKAIALKLAQQGIHVAISDVLQEAAEATAIELAKLGVKTMAIRTDVSKEADVEQMIAQVIKEWGSLEILINNAGITRDNLTIRMSEEEWDKVIDINLKGTFLCSKHAAKEMMKKRFGRIVNIASVVGVIGTAGQANYAASKAGVITLSKSFARELGARNITVNAVLPGFIQTEMTHALPEKVKEDYLTQIALKRPGTPEDVAEAVYFLVSPAAQYITGTVINVSGGLLM